jgi:hypothetical protein
MAGKKKLVVKRPAPSPKHRTLAAVSGVGLFSVAIIFMYLDRRKGTAWSSARA